MFKKAIAMALLGASILSPVYAKGSITVYGPGMGAVKSTCNASGGSGGSSMRAKGFYSLLGTSFATLSDAQRTLTIKVNAGGGSGYGTGGAGGGYSSISLNGTSIIYMAGGGGGGGGYATTALTSYAGQEWTSQHEYRTCSATNGSTGGSVSPSNAAATSGSNNGGSGTSVSGGGGGGGNNGGVGGSGTSGGAAGRISGQAYTSSCTATDLTNEKTCYITQAATGTPTVKISYIRESLATF